MHFFYTVTTVLRSASSLNHVISLVMCGVLLLTSVMLCCFVPELNFLRVWCKFLLLGVTAGLLWCITSNYRHILMQWQLYWPESWRPSASAEKDQNRAFLGKCHTLQLSVCSALRVRRFNVKICLKMTAQLLAFVFNGFSTTQAEKPVVLYSYNRGRNSTYKREIKQTWLY